jgi:H3 lysine-79-specific histone-lysine N-methyltransferase
LPRSIKTGPGLGGLKGKKTGSLGLANLESLDMMHRASLDQIKECHNVETIPAGCLDEKLSILPPMEMTHDELPMHVYTADGQQIPYGLHVLLENMKKQYLKMVTTLQSKEYADGIQEEIEKEQERKEQLSKRVKQLENQIDNLIQDSLGLLKARLRELGITATTPTEFIEKAKGIVCSHNELQKKRGGLEAEIRRLELDQEALITRYSYRVKKGIVSSTSRSGKRKRSWTPCWLRELVWEVRIRRST